MPILTSLLSSSLLGCGLPKGSLGALLLLALFTATQGDFVWICTEGFFGNSVLLSFIQIYKLRMRFIIYM